VAVHETLRNAGSETAGIDNVTKSNLLGDLDGYITRLRESLKAKTYEPQPVRRVYIPKPGSEKKRPLGIPTLLDRIVQEALRMILEPIWEADFNAWCELAKSLKRKGGFTDTQTESRLVQGITPLFSMTAFQ
jgi:retron-type reverse transcriptase